MKQSVFIDSMILYIENPKDSTQKTLWINQTNESNHMNPGMLQNTKINIQNQIRSYRLVTSHPKKKLRKQVSLTLASKNNILRRLETGCQSEGHELPPLMKTPRSYLTAEQSSTKVTRTYQKQDNMKHAFTIKSHTTHMGNPQTGTYITETVSQELRQNPISGFPD